MSTPPSADISVRSLLIIGFTLFALFFGAGNLIFPAAMGQQAGSNLWPAVAGFLITGVGLPLAGVVAMGVSGCHSLEELAGRVHPLYGRSFTVALYLTIGPFFAAPRTATVAFEMGPAALTNGSTRTMALVAFAAVFFCVALSLALSPGRMVDRIGRLLTPALLITMTMLIAATIVAPMGVPAAPQAAYDAHPLSHGFLDGYNTMDALASLVFGILVINAVRASGAQSTQAMTRATVGAGLIAATCLTLVYIFIASMGATSVNILGLQSNGAPVLSGIARHYYGGWGMALLGTIVLLACLTTAIGLIAACATYFHAMMPRLNHMKWAAVFAAISFGVACFGLDTLIKAAIPVLVFLYPLTVALIALAFLHPLFKGRAAVYRSTMLLTGVVAAAYGLKVAGLLPPQIDAVLNSLLPWYSSDMGWLLPAVVGLGIGWGWTLAKPLPATATPAEAPQE